MPPQLPTTSSKTKYEDVAGVGVVGMGILFLSVFGSEALALRRARGHSADPHGRHAGLPGASSPAAVAAAQLPHYRDPDLYPEDEDETEPWIDIEPLPLEHLVITDHDPGSR